MELMDSELQIGMNCHLGAGNFDLGLLEDQTVYFTAEQKDPIVEM